MKRRGPIHEPCGTPLKTRDDGEKDPSTFTFWVLSFRKFAIQSIKPLPKPNIFNLCIRRRWSMLSNAFLKSKKTESTVLLHCRKDKERVSVDRSCICSTTMTSWSSSCSWDFINDAKVLRQHCHHPARWPYWSTLITTNSNLLKDRIRKTCLQEKFIVE